MNSHWIFVDTVATGSILVCLLAIDSMVFLLRSNIPADNGSSSKALTLIGYTVSYYFIYYSIVQIAILLSYAPLVGI